MDGSTSGRIVPIDQLEPREWVQLVLGLFSRFLVWSLATGVVGGALSYALAIGAWAALGGRSAASTFDRFGLPIAAAVSLLVGVGAMWLLARLMLTGRYGTLRLAVVREAEGAAGVARPA